MPSRTPLYSLPYPDLSDPIRDGASTMRELAEKLEDALAGVDSGNPIVPPPTVTKTVQFGAFVDATTSARTTLSSATIADPGYPYLILPFVSVECGRFTTAAQKAVVDVTVGTTTGTVVGRGLGVNDSDWHTATVVPTPAGPFTGNRTIYVVGYSAFGGEVKFSKYLALGGAFIVRAG